MTVVKVNLPYRSRLSLNVAMIKLEDAKEHAKELKWVDDDRPKLYGLMEAHDHGK